MDAALQRRDRVFPELAALDVMSANLRRQLSRHGLSGQSTSSAS